MQYMFELCQKVMPIELSCGNDGNFKYKFVFDLLQLTS